MKSAVLQNVPDRLHKNTCACTHSFGAAKIPERNTFIQHAQPVSRGVSEESNGCYYIFF